MRQIARPDWTLIEPCHGGALLSRCANRFFPARRLDLRFLAGALFTYVGLAVLDVWWGAKKPGHHSRHLGSPGVVRVVEATYVTLVVVPCTFLLFPVFVLLFTGPVMLGGLWRKGPYWRHKLPNPFERWKESDDEVEWQTSKWDYAFLRP